MRDWRGLRAKLSAVQQICFGFPFRRGLIHSTTCPDMEGLHEQESLEWQSGAKVETLWQEKSLDWELWLPEPWPQAALGAIWPRFPLGPNKTAQAPGPPCAKRRPWLGLLSRLAH